MNDKLLKELGKHFFIVENGIGMNPSEPRAKRMDEEGGMYQSDETEDEGVKCVLTGFIPKGDTEFVRFSEHTAPRHFGCKTKKESR